MTPVQGIHHVTLLASSAPASDGFWRHHVGLERVKMTVNADHEEGYHLFYGDAEGTPGTLVTVQSFANLSRGAPGVGEICGLALSVGVGALQEWRPHMMRQSYELEPIVRSFGRNRLNAEVVDGQRLAFQVEPQEQRPPRPGPMDNRKNVRGLHSVLLRVRDGRPVEDMLGLLGYENFGTDNGVTRYTLPGPVSGARSVDVVELPDAPAAQLGAGSIHHVAFGVLDRGELEDARSDLASAALPATAVANRRWFESFYFRGPDGLLFEVATQGDGLVRDEPIAGRGARLDLPPSLEGRRTSIEARLEPLED